MERGRLFAAVGPLLDAAASLRREREAGQSSLFGDGGDASIGVVAPPLPDVPEWTARDRSAREKEVLGFCCSEHPLSRAQRLRPWHPPIADAGELETAPRCGSRAGGEVKPS